jgi:thioredoxin reductase (NADPH)
VSAAALRPPTKETKVHDDAAAARDDEQVYDLIVIGAGPAGLTAAIYASRAGLRTLILERQLAGGQVAMTDVIENYPGFEEGVGGFELIDQMKNQATRFEAELREIEGVDRLEVEADGRTKTVHTGAEIYRGRSVILATGLDPKGLGCKGEGAFTGRGVSYCATCDGAFFRDKVVAVIGGGNSAVEEALFLTRFARKVYLVHRRDQLRADQVYRRRADENPKIEILWRSELREVRGDDKVTSMYVEFTDKAEYHDIKVDGVFFYVGQSPNTAFVQDLVELDERGFVTTDEQLRTSVPGVFAAGDCRANELKQVVWAAAEGALAVRGVEHYLEKLAEEDRAGRLSPQAG